MIAPIAVALALLAGVPGGSAKPVPMSHAIVVLGGSSTVAAQQRAFERALRAALPQASIRWRYRLVMNGVSVVLPSSALDKLHSLPGVREIVPETRYLQARTSSPRQIGAPALWGAALAHAGQGMKIGIIDDGVDQTHPYFDPAGYEMPAGFPKGQQAYTTAKVIVARAFAPPSPRWKSAGLPFDAENSEHGTHVAGIAAGNAATKAPNGQIASGVAPRAYLGNYKALTIPTDSGVGLDGNAPEIVAAIEAAVADGMDVINLSIGEPEIEPTRDAVALALDGAARAGVVPVVAAGNDFSSYGRGSVASPGSSAEAITVAATGALDGAGRPTLAGFSSAGPTPISLRLKPDVSAPGSGILSSVPNDWRAMSGTSMAAPHVAGAAALLKERHPEWTVAQLKSALIGTGRPVAGATSETEAPPTRGGGGFVDLPTADNPLVLSIPSAVSFGLVRAESTVTARVDLQDAGGGAGEWTVAVQLVTAAGTASVSTLPVVTIPGPLDITLSTVGGALEEIGGFIRLERNGVVRRIPFWARVSNPALANVSPSRLAKAGVYNGDTRGLPALVEQYLYPELASGSQASSRLAGPEQVFRVRLSSSLANFGVVILSRGQGSLVEPRVVVAGDENRLTGYPGLPVNLNPYLSDFEGETLSAGALSPLPGEYDIVFDSPAAGDAGEFTFRLWLNDITPPAVRLVASVVKPERPLFVRVADRGSGIDPSSLVVTIDGTERDAKLQKGVVRISTLALKPGRHRLRLQLSDHQETRNMENVGPILPNTRVLVAKFSVRP